MTPNAVRDREEEQQQIARRAASDRVLAPLIADLRAKAALAREGARHGRQRARVIVDCRDLELILDALNPETRP